MCLYGELCVISHSLSALGYMCVHARMHASELNILTPLFSLLSLPILLLLLPKCYNNLRVFFFFEILFYFFMHWCLPECYVCEPSVCSAQRGQTKMSAPGTGAAGMWGPGIEQGSTGEHRPVLLTAEHSSSH